MMRLIIVAVGGLLLGIGGGVGAAWLRKPDAPTVAQAAAAADSAAVADSVAAPVECVPVTAADSSAAADTTHARADNSSIADKANAPAANGTAIAAAADAAGTERDRLVRIMAAMKATDAARALVSLDDAQVEAVLFGLTERKAAAILSSFPADRAGKLMQSILRRRQS